MGRDDSDSPTANHDGMAFSGPKPDLLASL